MGCWTGKNGQVLIKVQSCYVLNLASNNVDGPYNNVTETPHKKIKIQRLKCTQNMIWGKKHDKKGKPQYSHQDHVPVLFCPPQIHTDLSGIKPQPLWQLVNDYLPNCSGNTAEVYWIELNWVHILWIQNSFNISQVMGSHTLRHSMVFWAHTGKE